MRLKSIRLAGFKSFVDPTTVTFPGNMSAVVGPNGCGKSNIIDAVRWVMGESSAKNLRGESMTDVIFNGSNTRKPVSQASIELVFDNSDGSLGGEYAAFAEISIRRKVTRDAQNTYFLNGSKCRRRDITDIFLGTGLGPRSYSIIEQGMISRLIEARPEDLRHFIEEAAGISRYKERRRETENRIRRTQENLARLGDLREELERQLERLQRQAQAAEKYQQYKDEERQTTARLLALRWRSLDSQREQKQGAIAAGETRLEALIADQRHSDASIEQLRDRHHEQTERFNRIQGRFYGTGSEIARVEQSIQHSQQRLQQLASDLREAEQLREETRQLLAQDQSRLETVEEEIRHLEPEQETLDAITEEAAAAMEEAGQVTRHWQEHWEAFSQRSALPQRAADVQQSVIRQLEQQLEQLASRQQRLDDEQLQQTQASDDEEIADLREQLAMLALQQEEQTAAETSLSGQLEQQRQVLEQLRSQHQQQSGELQRHEGHMASLENLQQAALNPGKGVMEWLQEQQLDQQPRLAETLHVDSGWEMAVETVLGTHLQAVLVSQLPERPGPFDFDEGELCLLTLPPATPATAPDSLQARVQSPYDLSPWLAGIRTADSLPEAFEKWPRLAAHESLITADGYWLGPHFLRIHRSHQAESGILARTQLLEQLYQQRSLLEESLAGLDTRQAQAREQLQQQEATREQLQQQIRQDIRQQAELTARLSAHQARQEQLEQPRQQQALELQEISSQEQAITRQLEEARLELQEALESMTQLQLEREALQAGREQSQAQLEQLRLQLQQYKDQAHQLNMRLTALRTQRTATGQSMERLHQQQARNSERHEQLSLLQSEGGEPLEELRATLEELLGQRLAVEEELQQARQVLETLDSQLRDDERNRNQAEQQAQEQRTHLEQLRMEWQALDIQGKTLQEQLRTEGYDLHTVLAHLDPALDEASLKDSLDSLAARIQRPGPINLAAIDEYRQQSERKQYLDRQNDDLAEALQTLENVIRKIDQETRNRFRETFEQINSGLQALFPRVFGGGTAYLEFTGEDLLGTGVAIMARPPGKKNSTIHLLSGGEKALTALALVFAIFQLNPAPFCMLDEVDAPLDDANVGRYARLVREMSGTVQFIYITHNKIAMEMADQLMGVTMHEPGCSRLVAVDIEEAALLAAS